MRYHDMLRDYVEDFLILSSYNTLDDMIARAWEREIELQLRLKRGPKQVQTTVGKQRGPRFKICD